MYYFEGIITHSNCQHKQKFRRHNQKTKREKVNLKTLILFIQNIYYLIKEATTSTLCNEIYHLTLKVLEDKYKSIKYTTALNKNVLSNTSGELLIFVFNVNGFHLFTY